MGAIRNAANAAYADFNIPNDDASGEKWPDKPSIRDLFGLIEDSAARVRPAISVMGYYSTGNYGSVEAAAIACDADALSAGSEWYCDGTVVLTANRSFSARVVFAGGAGITLSGFNLSVFGGFEAGRFQIFDDSGGGIVIGRVPEEVFPEWWGAKSYTSGLASLPDSTVPGQKALNFAGTGNGGKVKLLPAVYLANWIVPPDVSLEGAGAGYGYLSSFRSANSMVLAAAPGPVIDTPNGPKASFKGTHVSNLNVHGSAAWKTNVTGSIAVVGGVPILNATVVSSGSLFPGWVLSDLTGNLLAGTSIVNQLTGATGAAGTYVVSLAQTVASENMTALPGNTIGPASFTGSISGTTLAANGVTGTIAKGDLIPTAGVGAGTTIVQQLSGTPYRDGTYQVSQSQTVASQAMTCASPSSAQVQATCSGSVMTIIATTIGSVYVGMQIDGNFIPGGVTITSFGTYDGSTGTVNLSGSATVATSTRISLVAQTPNMGIRISSGQIWGSVEKVSVSFVADQNIFSGRASQGMVFNDILIVGGLINPPRAWCKAAAELHGIDNVKLGFAECGPSQTALSPYFNLDTTEALSCFTAGIWFDGRLAEFSGDWSVTGYTEGENADVGIYTSASDSTFDGMNPNFNFGPGHLDSSINSEFANERLYSNSRASANAYDGIWRFSGGDTGKCNFVNIQGYNPGGGSVMRHLITDNFNYASAPRLSTYALCEGALGASTYNFTDTVKGPQVIIPSGAAKALTTNSTTPSIDNNTNFLTANTTGTAYSYFSDGVNGQVIVVTVKDNFSSFVHGSTAGTGLRLVNNANHVALNGETLTFKKDNGVFVEIGSRMTLSGTMSWTPGAIAAGGSATTSVTVTGLLVGDFVEISRPGTGNGCQLEATLATNTLTLTYRNQTAGSLTPTAGTFGYRCVRI